MKKIYLSIITMLFILPKSLFSQVITGIVKDAQTKRPVNFCSVQILQIPTGTTTDANGIFKINIPENAEHFRLIFSAIGYQRDTIDAQNNLTVYLTPQNNLLNDVVVTGTSKAIRIKENPVAMVSVSQKAIEQTISENTIDAISQNAPGFAAVKTGPNVSKPFINGLGYNRVLTLYDGVLRVETQQWGDEHGVPMDDYTIDRAEVIEGPSSLMYGSDAIAGVLSMFVVLPKDTDRLIHGKFLSEYQTNNGLIGNSLILNYGSKHWSYALRGSERIAKNYSNPIDGRVYNTGFKMQNLSAFAGYKNAKGYSHFNLTYYNNRQGIPDGSRDSLTRKFTYQIYETEGENINIPQVDTITIRPIVPNNILNSYKLSPLSQRIQDFRIYTDNQYQLGQSEIKATLGFEQNIRREYDHPTDVNQAGEYIVLNTVDYAVRYNAPSVWNIQPSVGVNGMYQTNSNKNATDFPIPDYHLFDIGSYFYGLWKYKQWTIAGGIRYDRRSENGDDMYIKANPVTGFYRQVFSNDTVGSAHQFNAFHFSFQGITGSVGATYALNNQISLKVNIARGYRAPNITEIASNGLDPGAHIYYVGNLDFKPEFSLQEDLGLLGTYNDFSFELSVYNNYIQNYIYEDLEVDKNGVPVVIVPGNKTFQYQQTNAELYGLNATFNVHPQSWKAFQFDNSFSMVYGNNLNPKYKNAKTQGQYLPFIPPPRWLSSIDYDIETKNKILQNISLKVTTDLNLAQNRYLGLYNTETPTAVYTLLNFYATADVHYSKNNIINVECAVNNLLNTAYQNHLSRLQYFEYYTQSPNGHLGIYNPGRNFCFKVIVPF
ncbi:energy transducer TonB [Arachidicoccus ginsenosidimutans]|uniref:TonB-dependent receptor n=1 Tax=Arachidicoccus sp. BS20 TaxID=1850526 RepID=UPI0007F0DDE0|nr:TonB-dependent receptor [Arachidicoccus sp. BS20]ANI89046.1 energy transducer TonB [Arachidicoccus sp. BS20]